MLCGSDTSIALITFDGSGAWRVSVIMEVLVSASWKTFDIVRSSALMEELVEKNSCSLWP